jgi:hypothetical protein
MARLVPGSLESAMRFIIAYAGIGTSGCGSGITAKRLVFRTAPGLPDCTGAASSLSSSTDRSSWIIIIGLLGWGVPARPIRVRRAPAASPVSNDI